VAETFYHRAREPPTPPHPKFFFKKEIEKKHTKIIHKQAFAVLHRYCTFLPLPPRTQTWPVFAASAAQASTAGDPVAVPTTPPTPANAATPAAMLSTHARAV
jgi:hypothetical protein